MPADPGIVNHSDMPVLGGPQVATIDLLIVVTPGTAWEQR